MSENNKEFIGGFYPKPKHEKTPTFIHGKGSFNVDQAYDFFKAKKEAGEKWVNYQTKSQKKDESKWYAEVDNWKPEAKTETASTGTKEESINPENIPF